MSSIIEWRQDASLYAEQGKGPREISRLLDVPYSSVWDYLNKGIERTVTYKSPTPDQPMLRWTSPVKSDIVRINTDQTKQGPTIIYIPDSQVKPDTDTEYLRCIGEYIAYKKPDVIVCAGDFADMPSLSSYDKGKKSAEGKRVALDIQASINGMNVLLSPIKATQIKDPSWKPRMTLTLGNHEERILRHVEANPELEGFLGLKELRYEDSGWEVVDFLKPVVIGGVTFIHYWPHPMTGKPMGGSALNVLKSTGCSVVQGHRQTLDVATRTLHTGVQQWSIIAGASYDFDESYKGFTGNKHHRGIVVMHNVEDGGFSPLFIDIEYLKKRFK